MPPNINSLVAEPGSPSPPDVQGATGQDSASLQGLMGQGQPQGGGTMQPPSHHEAVALLNHLSAFRRRWKEILDDPETGSKSINGMVYDMMADMMSDGYATLPEVMGLLKTIPDNPLEQRQWVQQHIQNDDQAMMAVLQHHAQGSPPPGPWQQEMAAAGQAPGDRASLVNAAHARYKKFPAKPKNVKGIPLNG